MVQLVIKCSGGLIKEERQAEYVLLGLAVLFFSVSMYLFFFAGKTTQKFTPPPPEVLEQMKKMSANH